MTFLLTYRTRSTDVKVQQKVLCQYCLVWMSDPQRHWIESTAPIEGECAGKYHGTRPTADRLRVKLDHAEQSLDFRRQEYAADPTPSRRLAVERAKSTAQAAEQRLADRIAS